MIPWATNDTRAKIRSLLEPDSNAVFGVLGLGVVGRALARSLLNRGHRVRAFDQNPALEIDSELKELEALGLELHIGPLDESLTQELDGLAISPGVHPGQTVVQKFIDQDKPVFGELELIGDFPVPVIAVTGTNGKSTTTSLIAHLLKEVGLRVFVGGNLGAPIIEWIDSDEEVDVAVLELSSFQLETAYSFSPAIGLVLNISPDHSERYDSYGDYVLTKSRLISAIGDNGVAILNRDDSLVANMARLTQTTHWFSSQGGLTEGIGLAQVAGQILASEPYEDFNELSLEHSSLPGEHNHENALASFLAVRAFMKNQVSSTTLLEAYREFRGLEHRLEKVGVLCGATYFNDSKATNDISAAVAIKALDGPLLLLMGGKDKGDGYAHSRQWASGKTRLVIAFGEASEKIHEDFCEGFEVLTCPTMQSACEAARRRALPGDTVLLSPACSSFDEFKNFRQRGTAFKKWFVERKKQECDHA